MLAGSAAAAVVSAGPASAYPSSTINLEGHGWGNAIGMGQWGALGYSLEDGWSYRQILSHFYGPLVGGGTTSIGKLTGSADSTVVRVAMTEDDGIVAGHHLTLVVHRRRCALLSRRGSSARGHLERQHELERRGSAGRMQRFVLDAHCRSKRRQPDCGSGGRGAVARQRRSRERGARAVRGRRHRRDCAGTSRQLPTRLHELRTVSFVPLEPYVADVTPSESPAYWGTIGTAGAQGEPRGFQELEAQAVAARSYVMSDLGGYGGYADTCDLDCQSYPGITNEDPLATQAVRDTLGTVVVHAGREGRDDAVLLVDGGLDRRVDVRGGPGRRRLGLRARRVQPASHLECLDPGERRRVEVPVDRDARVACRSRAATGSGTSAGGSCRCPSSALTGP